MLLLTTVHGLLLIVVNLSGTTSEEPESSRLEVVIQPVIAPSFWVRSNLLTGALARQPY